MPIFEPAIWDGIVERERRHEQRDREADAREHPRGGDHPPVHAPRKHRDPGTDRDPAEDGHTEWLAHDESDAHRQRDLLGHGVAEGRGVEDHTGVRQREHRHDEVGHRLLEQVHQEVEGREALAAHARQQPEHVVALVAAVIAELLRFLGLAREEVVEVVEGVPPAFEERLVVVVVGHRRSDEPEQHAGDRGVDAGVMGLVPHEGAHEDVDEERAHPDHVEHGTEHETRRSPGEGVQVELGRVEQGDHRHGAQVVGDREREQEDAQAGRHPASQHGQGRHREGDVGRHRDAPTPLRRAAQMEREVHRRGNDHPAHGPEHRQHRLSSGRELPMDHLALDLHPDGEEEDPHQAIVDPVAERHLDREHVAQRDPERGRPEREIARGPRGVGPDQGHEGHPEQQQRAADLEFEEHDERPRQAIGKAGPPEGPGRR